jgi:hypothetical protein
VCRENSVSEATYYQWKSKYGGMEASDVRKLRDLQDENRKLKQMYADPSYLDFTKYWGNPQTFTMGRKKYSF